MKSLIDSEIGVCAWDFVQVLSSLFSFLSLYLFISLFIFFFFFSQEEPDELSLFVGDLVEVLVHDGEWTRFVDCCL